MSQVQPFQIAVSENILTDLKKRLANTRWPDEITGSDWNYGTNRSYLKELCRYWEKDFDWQKQEAMLNQLPHFKTAIEGLQIHFIHEKGKGQKTIPLLLTHGYPDSFIRFLKIIPLLTAADADGFSFEVIIPSIPGFGFSDKPTEPGMNSEQIAGIFQKLMTEVLGFEKYMAQGGDWGSSITEQLAYQYPGSLISIHLTDIPYNHLFTVKPEDLAEPEKQYLEKGKKWQMTEGAYAMIQGSKPQTLAYGINDSPAGLAGWIIEKFRTWSDCNGDIETRFTKEELLTNLTIYWATQTANSAFRIYFETMVHQPKQGKKVDIPTGVCIFPKDIVPAPIEYGKRFFNIQHWAEMPAGGHFAAMEEPEKLAADIRSFAKSINTM